ncbi:NADH-quinone oxidoreductase subunit C [Candidatus Sumerlaeota bacterium]|nr:NADH-quinone oxidoreductase subunit C [Candidatus Sumerlaeota bacterium]
MTPTDPTPTLLHNGRSLALGEIPRLAPEHFESTLVHEVSNGQRVSTLFGGMAEGGEAVDLYAILAHDSENRLSVVRTIIGGKTFPSVTPRLPQVNLFEREIAEQFGVRPEGHPWFKPVRYRRSWVPGRDAWDRPADDPILPGVGDFYRVEGEEVHEVAVGPVHAGVIEPGHFRFQCHGEQVFHLEIALGYQHRGVEEALMGGPNHRSIHYAETLAGDSTCAHAIAYCQVVEALSGCRKTARAQSLRGIALELERLANHVGDLGALANDVGFLPTASYCGRIRGDFLNMTALLCGNRFGRGMIRPGGVGFDVDNARVAELLKRLDAAERDTSNAVDLLWDTPSVMARFEDTGPLPARVCQELGIVGPAARASGLNRDVRQDQPSGIYRFVQIPISTWHTGDVFSRAYVRWLEIQQSLLFIREQLQALPSGTIEGETRKFAPNSLAISLIEGWRGEVCHVAITDDQGRFARYKVVDPSFHNWNGLAYALRGQQISDFPLCNKSFNLSYCGHDL